MYVCFKMSVLVVETVPMVKVETLVQVGLSYFVLVEKQKTGFKT